MQYMLQNNQDRLKNTHLTLLLALLDDLLILPVVGHLPSPAATPHCEGAPLLALLNGMLLRPIVVRLSLPVAPPQTAQGPNSYSELFEKFWSQISFSLLVPTKI